jgi:GNAT superfamily N-acetyltransferase
VADVSVRPAREDDASEIGRVQIVTWQTAYSSILPTEIVEALSADAAAQVWRDAIGTPPSPHHRVLVALEGQWLVGFVVLAPEDDSAAVGPLLVEPRWGRRGHGSRLLAAAVDTARQGGYSQAVAWLPEADQVSRTFFGSAGWASDGAARVLDTGAGTVREIRIHTSLAD